MTELFLIAHKVRGEPAFDVAERLQIGDELGWIIPTSGHRAYPYWCHPLSQSFMLAVIEEGLPSDLRDHYAAHAAPAPAGGKITSLSLADLGL